MPVEYEIKFTVPDRTIFERVVSLGVIAGYKIIDRGLKLHTDTYFDTEDYQLFREKVVFRLRKRDDQSTLTFKARCPSGESSDDSIHRRIEIEHTIDATVDDIIQGTFPDIPPLEALHKYVENVKLFPSLTVKNRRRILFLTKEDTPRFELALDDVLFSGPGGEKHVWELEVESLTGTEDDLSKIGAWFADRFNLQPAGPSKYILGMKLVGNVSGL